MDKHNSINNIIHIINSYKGIIFDLDGTLGKLHIDWPRLKKRLSQYSLDKGYGNIEFQPLAQTLFFIKGTYGQVVFHNFLHIVKEEEKKSVFTPNRAIIACMNTATDKKIGIYSMNTTSCIQSISTKYFGRSPDIIIGLDVATEVKPGREDIDRIIGRWSMTKSDVILVGDSDVDMYSGQLAGIATVRINYEK